jgi:hypothetical protein
VCVYMCVLVFFLFSIIMCFSKYFHTYHNIPINNDSNNINDNNNNNNHVILSLQECVYGEGCVPHGQKVCLSFFLIYMSLHTLTDN